MIYKPENQVEIKYDLYKQNQNFVIKCYIIVTRDYSWHSKFESLFLNT